MVDVVLDPGCFRHARSLSVEFRYRLELFVAQPVRRSRDPSGLCQSCRYKHSHRISSVVFTLLLEQYLPARSIGRSPALVYQIPVALQVRGIVLPAPF